MKVVLAAILAMPIVGLGQNAAEPKFEMTGHVSGLTEHSLVFVTDPNNPTDTLAQSMVKDGAFVLHGHVAEPNLYELNFNAVGKKTPLFMGNDKMTLTGSVDDLKELKVTGSSSNDDFLEFQRQF